MMARALSDSVTVLKGVGAKKAALLEKVGISTVEDLLYHFPFRYEDVSVKSAGELVDNTKASVKGVVATEPVVQYFGRNRNRLTFRLAMDHEVLQVIFFNQPYLKKNIQVNQEIVVYGKFEAAKQQIVGIKLFSNHQDEESGDNDFEAIYHLTQGLSTKSLTDLIKQAIDLYGDLVVELLPEALREKYQLMPHKLAIQQIHFPDSQENNRQSRRQLKYQELFLYALKLQWRKLQQRRIANGAQILYDNDHLRDFIQTIPFELTAGQKAVVNEICADLRQPFQMNRLLQGDVGSGKTVVAMICLVATIDAGFQGAMMVPTEILADQHFASISGFFEKTDYKVALLTGSTKTKARREILADLVNGDIDLLIGTHALIQDDVKFADLGMVVIDEQHRFGVNQRSKLVAKGEFKAPNVLYMTATPIPRTLEITMMGDMDVSKLKEMPSGRIPIETSWVRHNRQAQVDEQIWREVRKGRQVYIICPLIGESEALEAQNAEHIYETYVAQFGGQFSVGLLHGQMSADEKDQVMDAFKNNDIQILVSTTVIEVGVNVPNATYMVILDADRFGLAQLHQLRGRVGRGEHASYCVLVADPRTDNGKQRMNIMVESTDGFYLSQQDLELRGAGDYFGTRQSGLPEFKVADPIEDGVILEVAREDAIQFIPYFEGHLNEFTDLAEWLEQQVTTINA